MMSELELIKGKTIRKCSICNCEILSGQYYLRAKNFTLWLCCLGCGKEKIVNNLFDLEIRKKEYKKLLKKITDEKVIKENMCVSLKY